MIISDVTIDEVKGCKGPPKIVAGKKMVICSSFVDILMTFFFSLVGNRFPNYETMNEMNKTDNILIVCPSF